MDEFEDGQDLKYNLIIDIMKQGNLEFIDEHKLTISVNKQCVIGRSKESTDIHLDDPSASRQHISFKLFKDKVWVKDMGTKNGTYLNSRLVDFSAIKQNDTISIGAYIIHIKEITKQYIDREEFTKTFVRPNSDLEKNEGTITIMLKKLLGKK